MSDWQKQKAAKCGCRGSNDLCGCQNEDPDDYPKSKDLSPTPAQIMADPRVKALVERVEQLNAACDAMWNDHDRVEKCSDSIRGTPYALKEKHMKAISEAQQRLPAALAQLKEMKP